MKHTIFPLLLLLCFSTSAQMAIINDPDGYTNVHKEANGQLEVIYQLKENEIFWIREDSFNPDYEEMLGIRILCVQPERFRQSRWRY